MCTWAADQKHYQLGNNVSVIIKKQNIHSSLEIGYRLKVKLFIQMIHKMLSPTQAHLSVTQINSTRFHLIGTVELIMCLKCLKTDLKLKF